MEVDPSGDGELYPGGCFGVAVTFTEGGTAQSPSFRIQYDPNVVSITSAEASACAATPAISHSITCADGTVGAATGKRTVGVIYGSTTPPSNVPSHVLGPLEFCVDSSFSGPFPDTTAFEFVDVSASIPSSTDDSATITSAPAPALSLSTTSETFSAALGSTTTKTITVTNSGNADGLTGAFSFSGTDVGRFSDTSNSTCGDTIQLAQGASCTIEVEFNPGTTGSPPISFSAKLDVTTNGGDESVDLDGTGTAGPAGVITITPAGPFDFGDILTGVEEPTQEFTVTNTGQPGSVVTIATAELSLLLGSPLSITENTCIQTGTDVELEKDETCSVTVKDAPTSDGLSERTLTVTGTDANSTQLSDSVQIDGTGVTEARPTSDPDAGTSESVVVGPEGSNDFTIDWGNEGNDSYSVSCGLIGDYDTAVWSVTGGSATEVTPGGSHTVTTSCSLPDAETYTATLECDLGQETATFEYECVGLPPLPIPVDNKWALTLLALMMLLVAGFGFRFFARQ